MLGEKWQLAYRGRSSQEKAPSRDLDAPIQESIECTLVEYENHSHLATDQEDCVAIVRGGIESRISWVLAIVGLLAGLMIGAPVAAQDAAADTVDVATLARQIEALTLEMEALRLGSDIVTQADTSALGFGPAASKVYGIAQGVSLGGYGEVVYENFSDSREDGSPSGKTDQADALRGIIYVGYKFDDRFLFNSEIELEHATTGQAGSASLEFAYLDYRLNPVFGLRGGLLLVPMGFVNELHEPPIFLGAKRPVTENRIIPTTWRENGVGFFGQTDALDYRFYLINSLDGVGGGSSKASGFSSSGLRGGRQKGSKALAESFSAVGRLDYVGTLGLTVGTSLYLGDSGHGRSVEGGGAAVDVRTLIWEGHAAYETSGLELRGLFALADLSDVTELNTLRGLTGGASVGERLWGGYVEAGYNVLTTAATTHQLIPFVRYEKVDTQATVPSGFSSDPVNDETIVTLGLSWKPLPQIVGKLDYEIHENGAGAGVDQFNIALGYLF